MLRTNSRPTEMKSVMRTQHRHFIKLSIQVIPKVLPELSITEQNAFYILKYSLQFYKTLGRCGGWGCERWAIPRPLPLITAEAWRLSRKAKDNSFIPAGETWPKTKKYILRCKCHYNMDESWGNRKTTQIWGELALSNSLNPLHEES